MNGLFAGLASCLVGWWRDFHVGAVWFGGLDGLLEPET